LQNQQFTAIYRGMVTAIKQANEIIEQKQVHIEELTKKLHSAQLNINVLQHQVEQLLRRVYGRRSEKLDPRQMMFDSFVLEAAQQPEADPTPPVEPKDSPDPPPKSPRRKNRNHPGRIPIPEHLERVEIVLDIPEKEKVCPETAKPLKQIGWESSEKLEYRPGRFIVNVYKRPKYASPDSIAAGHVGIITAPMPDHPIEKCKADVGLISHIIVSKFADHLPLYRQNGIFDRENVEIPRATQTSWLLQTHEAIKLLWQTLKEVVLKSDIIFTDDTPIPLLVKGNGRTKKARLWVYVRGGPGPSLTVYDFSRDRKQERPLAFLGNYEGYIHADAYSGYDALFQEENVIEVACWTHARRKFDEATSSRPVEATEILAYIARIYRVESECRAMDPQDRYLIRQQKSKPILDAIFDRLEALKAATIPKEPLRKAVDYALNQRDALYRYLDDGRLKPDNNTAENAIRPLALGRKNWLFAGSERGGQAAALFYSLIQSCKACDVNPWEYLNDMLRRIMSHPVTRLRELLPDQWQPLPKNEYGLIIPAH
jgi:transposase